LTEGVVICGQNNISEAEREKSNKYKENKDKRKKE